jgi:poly(3-hydroxybutyrate) depolymerase
MARLPGLVLLFAGLASAAAFAACGASDAGDDGAEIAEDASADLGERPEGGGGADTGTQPDGDASDTGAPDGGPDTGGPCADAATTCNGDGLCKPIVACSVSSPCADDAGAKTTVLPPLDCKTDPQSTTRLIVDDNPPRSWTDTVTAEPRGACVFHPAGASAASKRPLVVFFHGSTTEVHTLYDSMQLRAKAVAFDLANDAARLGFHLTFEQGRVLPNPNGNLGPAPRRDIYFRDFGSPSANPDVRNADRLIDELVAVGDVDPKRVYVMGWSNGAFFGASYAIARHTKATPGGNRVAAAVLYAGGDPFQEFEPGQAECRLNPAPLTSLPILLVHRSCDAAVPCNAAQRTKFGEPPGYDNTAWLASLQGPMGDTNAQRLLVAANGATAVACETALGCGKAEGFIAHLRWPDGVGDGSGIDREPTMLEFLRAHPLP